MKDSRYSLDKETLNNARLAQEYLDIVEVLIMTLDVHHNVTMINQKGAALLGYTKEEIIGKNFMQNFLPERIRNEIVKLGEEIVEDETKFKRYYENPILTKDGEERLIAWKNTQLKDENGKSIGILTSGEDITELRNQSKFILQKSRLEQMGEMMSMIAHQWKQPLGAISSVSSSMLIQMQLNSFNLEKEGGAQKLQETLEMHLHKINEYVQNLSTIIDDFKTFYVPNKIAEIITLDRVIESALNIISSSFIPTQTKLVKTYKNLCDVEVFYGELTQVIVSILQNSQENFIEKEIQNPMIEIEVDGSFVRIADNGGGIDPVIMERIFEPYFSTKKSKNGTGLGMYMAKMIVEEHHKGKLRVANLQDGVCFTIELSKV